MSLRRFDWYLMVRVRCEDVWDAQYIDVGTHIDFAGLTAILSRNYGFGE